MNLEQLKTELQKRLIGTKITVISIDRKCGRLDVKYQMGKSTNTVNVYNPDPNDVAQDIANRIMMEEV